jgi:hypothetical protein
MKVGILIKKFEDLKNWELRIIDEIIKDPELELSLLIFDGRISEKKSSSIKDKLVRANKNKKLLSSIIFKLQILLENKLFKGHETVNKIDVINSLQGIKKVFLKPIKKGFLDVFNEKDSEIISKYDLDIILRHEFSIIRGPILKAAKFGIWSFHHGDNAVNRGGPPGFWEIILNQSTVGVTLQKLTPELDGGIVIDKAFFNTDWSYVRLNRTVLESSVSLLFKNINKLKNNNFSSNKSMVYYNPLYRSPKLKIVVLYLFKFYFKLFKIFFQILDRKIFSRRYNCWTLFIGKGNFLESTLFRLKPVKLPKNEFWADPFILNHNNENYIFFENYDYKLKKGKISCGIIRNNTLINIKDVLVKDYHLSFPYVFKENGEIYLMPETNANNQLELYKCISFPDKWELHSTAFEGEKVADAFFYNDNKAQKWLFINKQVDLNSIMNNELYIYKVDSVDLKNIESHKENPVIINSKTARNAGSIFNYKNQIYRPSQANMDSIYGRGLNINKIEKLNINEYIESKTTTVYPNFHDGLISTHHLSQKDGLFVIDAAFRKL